MTSRALQYLGGGLLQGAGKGMAAEIDGREKRELMLEQLRQRREEAGMDRDFRAGQAKEDREFRADQADQTRRHQSGLIHGTVTGKDGKVSGITRAGEAVDTGITAKGKGDDTMSADDKRLWDVVVKRHTTESLQGATVDYDAVAAEFRNRGRSDLAGLAVPEGQASKVDVSSPEYAEAKRLAERAARERTGWFTSRKSEFPETGGNMEEWETQERLRIYRTLTGKSGGEATPDADGADSADTNRPPQAGEEKARKLPASAQGGEKGNRGSGTQADPFKPTTQEEFAVIQPGEFYINPADGKLYRKKNQ